MSDPLARRIAARQRNVEAGGKTFTLRRPTEFEKVRYRDMTVLEYVSQFIDACDLTEADLFDGGADVAVPFDRELVFDWLQDRPDTWQTLTGALADMVKAHEESLGSALKN